MTKKIYMCDFETTTDPEDCRVWAACAVELETGRVVHLSNSIDSFMEWCQSEKGARLYFHNLRFDGEFILSWLFNHGFQHVGNELKAIPDRSFQTLISDMGQFYKMTIMFERRKKKGHVKIDIYDSLKKIPFKAAKIAKDYGLQQSKGEIDYTRFRPIDYELTPEEIDYITTDCQIVQQALQAQFQEGMLKMTSASDALSYYKEVMGRAFEYWFPVLPKILDDDIRKAYKGGFTWCNPKYAGQEIGAGIVLDVNSLYPWAMYHCMLPYGYPVYFEGPYIPDPMYPLYIVRVRCSFQVKDKHIPMIQIKKGIFQETEYLTASEVKIDGRMERIEVELTLTSVDLELFLNHYDVENINYISGFKFKGQVGMFREYIDKWMEVKATSPKNSAQRAISKLYLNSLYGKFASSTERLPKIPYLAPDGIVRYYTYHEPLRDNAGQLQFDEKGRLIFQRDENGVPVPREPEEVDPVYTPVGAFITAWARHKTITAAQSCYDRFIYADTDSLHLIGTELPEGLTIHPSDLGAWDHETTFSKAKYLRAKTYIETVDGKVKVTCAGMPENVKELVNYDNFHPGSSFPGKLLPHRVKGGVVLLPVDFTIKL